MGDKEKLIRTRHTIQKQIEVLDEYRNDIKFLEAKNQRLEKELVKAKGLIREIINRLRR